MKKGIIFNVERYTVHDGPGIRTTVFFKGCPMRCWWCHNPEGQSKRFELVYKQGRCDGCGECANSCSTSAITLLSNRVAITRKRCIVCGACAGRCPTEALSVAGEEMSVEQVMTIIEKDMPFYGESDGGVTFSGGEPLQQPDFLEALVKECVERNIHVALDTCGYAPSNVMDRFLDKIDLFLYDIKIIDPAKHRKYTGVSNELILENAKRIASEGARLSISIPIIPMINDGEDDIDKTGKFIASLGNVEWVSLLPYHRMGIDKYGNLGKRYKLKDVQTPSPQRMETIKEKLETFGLRVRVEER